MDFVWWWMVVTQCHLKQKRRICMHKRGCLQILRFLKMYLKYFSYLLEGV